MTEGGSKISELHVKKEWVEEDAFSCVTNHQSTSVKEEPADDQEAEGHYHIPEFIFSDIKADADFKYEDTCNDDKPEVKAVSMQGSETESSNLCGNANGVDEKELGELTLEYAEPKYSPNLLQADDIISNLNNARHEVIAGNEIQIKPEPNHSENQGTMNCTQYSKEDKACVLAKNVTNSDGKTALEYRLKSLRFFKTNNVNSTSSTNLRCNKCDFQTDFILYLRRHYKKWHASELYSCSMCGKMFRCKTGLRFHIRSFHSGSNTWFYCSQCAFKTRFYPLMQTHKKAHLTLLNCEHCEFKTLYKRSLLMHIKAKHPNLSKDNLKTIECTVCYKTFLNTRRLYLHQRIHSGYRPYLCSFCNFKTSAWNSLKSHENAIHIQPKKFRCTVCQRKFTTKRSTEDHFASHLHHKCPLCSFKSTHVRDLEKHCNSQHGVKQHECEFCHRMYATQGSLKSHKSVCKMKLITCNDITSVTELGRKQNVVKVNGSECSNSGNSTLGPFQCTDCQKYFGNKSWLKRHKSKQTSCLVFEPVVIQNVNRGHNCQSKKHGKKHALKNNIPVQDAKLTKAYYVCDACNEQFPAKKILIKHLSYCVFK